MTSTNALISLHKGYGLGDAVQISAVLRHVAAAHPDWTISFQAEEGRHQVGRGIVANTFTSVPITSSVRYDFEIPIILHDNWIPFADRPSTHVSKCLRDMFGLHWNPTLGRYKVNVTQQQIHDAASFFEKRRVRTNRQGRGVVCIHYLGDSDKTRKDLTHEQAYTICRCVLACGRIPLMLDWRDEWPGPVLGGTIETSYYLPSEWGSDAQRNCALISQCEAFVGIDSGPAKCAATTDTPSLVIWTGHHPAQFFDPAPNTTHLVPAGYHSMNPVRNDSGVVSWFESNYSTRMYTSDLVVGVCSWLREVLR